MKSLEVNTNTTVARFISQAQAQADADDDNKNRQEWIKSNFAQAVCVVSSIIWCQSTEIMLTDENPIESLHFWYDENENAL